MSDDRLVIPNMIIFSRKSYLEKFFFNNDLNKNIIMAINNTRYNNDELSLYQLEHFNKNTWKKKKEV